jgi:hypothetical protein
MRRRSFLPVICTGAVLLCAAPVLTRTWAEPRSPYSAANLAALRAQGPAGLQQLLAAHQAEFTRLQADPNSTDPKLQQLKAAVNTIGGAYDNWAAGLYWYTDLDRAKAEAAKEGKPILSLRMLGNLTDAYSCANSRFFRAALYPNAKINAQLREHFVLYWSSERPVPVVTIDFGDGRKIKRTLTGNSAHYLLDEQGRPLDMLPGLYAPGAFSRWLDEGEALYKDLAAKPETERAEALKTWHRQQLEKIWTDYAKANDFVQRRVPRVETKLEVPKDQMVPWVDFNVEQSLKMNPLLQERQATPSYYVRASAITGLTVSKRLVEVPIMDATRLYNSEPSANPVFTSGPNRADAYTRTFLPDSQLDAASLKLIQSQIPWAKVPDTQEVRAVVGPDSVIMAFQDQLALDTANNELKMHIPVHAAFASGQQGDFNTLNRCIYDRLFKTPSTDPWLGLDQRDTFSGLPNGGVIEPAAPVKAPVLQAKQGWANG